MNVTVGELDKYGGFWVTVTGSKDESDKGAGTKAAAAARRFAAENGLGKVNRITAGGSTKNGVWEYSARYMVEHKPEPKEPVSFGELTDWATDELAQIIRDADSRCQAQPIHRMRGVVAVGEVEINGRMVKACKQCIDHHRPLVGKLRWPL
jgi:hypothetical protein